MEGQIETVYRARVDSSGRIAIPAAARTRLGIQEGDEVVVFQEGDGLHVQTLGWVIQSAQNLFAAHVPANVSLAEELHHDRRQEAARE